MSGVRCASMPAAALGPAADLRRVRLASCKGDSDPRGAVTIVRELAKRYCASTSKHGTRSGVIEQSAQKRRAEARAHPHSIGSRTRNRGSSSSRLRGLGIPGVVGRARSRLSLKEKFSAALRFFFLVCHCASEPGGIGTGARVARNIAGSIFGKAGAAKAVGRTVNSSWLHGAGTRTWGRGAVHSCGGKTNLAESAAYLENAPGAQYGESPRWRHVKLSSISKRGAVLMHRVPVYDGAARPRLHAQRRSSGPSRQRQWFAGKSRAVGFAGATASCVLWPMRCLGRRT